MWTYEYKLGAYKSVKALMDQKPNYNVWNRGPQFLNFQSIFIQKCNNDNVI